MQQHILNKGFLEQSDKYKGILTKNIHAPYPMIMHSYIVICFLCITSWFFVDSCELFANFLWGCIADTEDLKDMGKIDQLKTTTKHNPCV